MVSDYPKATEAGIDMLMAAEKKNHGSPPHNLAHAKEILGIAEPKPDYSSPYLSALAWERKYLRARWEDAELALHASWREHKALGEKPVCQTGSRERRRLSRSEPKPCVAAEGTPRIG